MGVMHVLWSVEFFRLHPGEELEHSETSGPPWDGYEVKEDEDGAPYILAHRIHHEGINQPDDTEIKNGARKLDARVEDRIKAAKDMRTDIRKRGHAPDKKEKKAPPSKG